MTEFSFTSGPWWPYQDSTGAWNVATYRDDEDPATSPYIGASFGATICAHVGDHTEKRTDLHREGTAKLIAAAPALAEALSGLEGILATAESNASGNPEWEHVSKRINAARAALSLLNPEPTPAGEVVL